MVPAEASAPRMKETGPEAVPPLLSSGGTASGPVSFRRGADASAGTIKSGGATRRAAKMVVLDVDHPDIEEFVMTKAKEEDKIRALRDAGFDMDLGGEDIVSVQYQNANNSVRVSDDFMRAVESHGQFGLRARQTGEVIALLSGSRDPRMFERLIPEPEPPRKILPSLVFQSRIDSIVSSTERMKQAEHCGCSSKPTLTQTGELNAAIWWSKM